MFKDIRWRIAIPYVVLILLVMGALVIYVTREAREAQNQILQDTLLVEARGLADLAWPLLAVSDANGADELAKTWSEQVDRRVTIIAADGTVLGESDEDRTQMDNHLDRPEVRQARSQGQGTSIRFSDTLDTDMLYAAVRVKEGDEIIGFARLALPLQIVQTNVDQLQQAIVTAAVIAAAAAVLLAIILAGRITRSVRRLIRVASRLAGGDLDARARLTTADDLGDLGRALNFMADELRARVKDLADERGRLEAVLDNMADGAVITDDRGRVSLINPAASRLLHVDEEEAIGRSFAEVAWHHELIELWQRACGRREEEDAVIEIGLQDTFMRMIVSPLQTSGQGHCLVILQDLTRIRRLETVRRDFLSNISHELRTPLASLKALVETLQVGALDDPPAAQRFLYRADQEVDALSQMVEELLELTRIESGKVPLRLAETAVEDVILPPVERLRSQSERRNLELVIDIAPDLPPVLSDAARAQQVISNLLHNAIKFTPVGGTITVRAGLNHKGSFVLFSVMDTGFGIPAAELPRIFERFYKADRARSSGGTGLGLAISKHLVEAHGGEIWAKSKEGKGSTFYFSLPVATDEG
ncbi:MAG: ATP-binding protein [Chloroflexota bacterium]|jgi:two-component system phosphate regulon sensor histidine kinase PhoR